jgi:hypothetical protein
LWKLEVDNAGSGLRHLVGIANVLAVTVANIDIS